MKKKNFGTSANFLKETECLFLKASPLLNDWFLNNARNLPWRQSYDPYQVWISEIMLQQTRVETVIEYFSRWMKEFPTICSLYEANEEKVLKLWEGLGYYSRCRNIKKTAKILTEEHRGILPRNNKQLERLPGIGKYTAGAILNIAYQIPSGMVDGNISRMLSRLLDSDKPIEESATKNFFGEAVFRLTGAGNPRIIGQSLMEVGATLCKPQNPACGLCPVKTLCQSLKNQTVVQRPVKKKSPKPKPLTLYHYVSEFSQGFILKKNISSGWWAGLWCFPWAKPEEKANLEKSLGTGHLREWMRFTHGVTKYKVISVVYQISGAKVPENLNENFRLIPQESLGQLSMSLPSVKIREKILSPESK